MDLRLEAAAAVEFAANIANDADFRVPAVDWDLTTRRVLATEWIDATPLKDIATLRREGPRPEALRDQRHSKLPDATRCATASSTPTCIRAICSSTHKASLVAVDFGIMGRLDALSRRFMAETLAGFLAPRLPPRRGNPSASRLRAPAP